MLLAWHAAGQRWAYLAGATQWYGDLLGLPFFIFLLAGAANLATGGGQLFRKLTLFLVSAIPVMVLLGLVRAIALLRRGTGASWQDALGAFFMWQSTSLVVARASVLALFATKAAFLRTPKTSEQTSWWQAPRANWAESALAVFGFAGIIGSLNKANQSSGPLLAAMLLFPTLGMAAAPVNSWAARGAASGRRPRRRHRRPRPAVHRPPGGPVPQSGRPGPGQPRPGPELAPAVEHSVRHSVPHDLPDGHPACDAHRDTHLDSRAVRISDRLTLADPLSHTDIPNP